MSLTVDRGLANNLLYYFASIVITVLLWITLNDPFTQFMDYNRANCATAACSNGTTWIQQGWDNVMWVIFLLLMVFLIGVAIYESRRPGV